MSINNTYPTITPKDGMKFVTSGYGNYNITIEDLATYIGDSGGGGSTTVTTESISDATTLGRNLVKATDMGAARTLIGAGTSNLTLGTTATTAKAGNYQPTWEQVSGKPTAFPPILGLTAGTAKAGDWNPLNVTTTANGLMFATDKVKLDGISASSTNPLVAGTASIGTSTAYARADHVHPPQTTVNVATTLQTGRTFTITGGATGVGNTSFNGSQNITIDVEITPATTTTVGGVLKVSGVEDTSGEDLLAVKNTLNELLANLRTAGVMT